MRARWRVLLATLIVEVVATGAVLVYGPLSLVAVAIIYWIDLAFVIVRVVIRQLVEGEATVVQVPRALPPFRLLGHKRGTLHLTDRLPSVDVRSLPPVLFSLLILAASALSTAVVLAVSVPDQFWRAPVTPVVLVGAGIAAATKSWLVYPNRSASAESPGEGHSARNRQLLVLVYALVMFLVATFTTTALAEPDLENTVRFVASAVILLRVAYGIRVSRSAASATDADRRKESAVSDGDQSSALTPSIPDGQPLETTEPVSRSVLAAGVVNALTTGGVVDGRFSDAGLHLRFYSLFILVVGTLAAANGSLAFQVGIAGMILTALGFWLLSTVHMELAFGALEYRFHDSTVVAYDRRLEEPQWSIPYDSIDTVSVERGLFWSPGWLNSGSVTVELTDGTAPMSDRQGRATILFVSDPETVSDWIDGR